VKRNRKPTVIPSRRRAWMALKLLKGWNQKHGITALFTRMFRQRLIGRGK